MELSRILTIGLKGANVYGRFCQPVCKRYGINQMGFNTLMFFANNPEYNTARDLCRLRGIKSGIVSVAVENLIEAGYLTRRVDVADRRIQRLEVAKKAAGLVQAGRAAQREFKEALLSRLSSDEIERFAQISQKLIDTIDELNDGGGEK